MRCGHFQPCEIGCFAGLQVIRAGVFASFACRLQEMGCLPDGTTAESPRSRPPSPNTVFLDYTGLFWAYASVRMGKTGDEPAALRPHFDRRADAVFPPNSSTAWSPRRAGRRCATACCRRAFRLLRARFGTVLRRLLRGGDAESRRGALVGVGVGEELERPDEASLYKARARLGPEPLEALFTAVAQPLAAEATKGAFYVPGAS